MVFSGFGSIILDLLLVRQLLRSFGFFQSRFGTNGFLVFVVGHGWTYGFCSH